MCCNNLGAVDVSDVANVGLGGLWGKSPRTPKYRGRDVPIRMNLSFF